MFRKVDKEWFFEERDRGHVNCSSGAGTKNQCNQSKGRQTTSFTKTQFVLHKGRDKLVQKQYKRRHDNVARRIHWKLCKKHGLESSHRWYEHTHAEVVENDEVELY